MSTGTLLLIVLIIVLVAVLPRWPYSQEWGPIPGGVVGILLVILVVLLLLGRI